MINITHYAAYYLQQQFPAIEFVIEGELTGDPQDRVHLMGVSGQVQGYPLRRRDSQIQVRSYHKDQYECGRVAHQIFDYLRERHGVTWQPHPDAESGSEPVRVARVAALQEPTPFGRQQDGTFLYLFTVVVTFSG